MPRRSDIAGVGMAADERLSQCSAASCTLRRRTEQIVRFARLNILFYDEHVIDLYRRIRALYRMGEDTETAEKIPRQKGRAAIWPCDARPQRTSHETRFVLNRHLAKLLETKDHLWWAHQGSNLGPAD